MADEHTITVNIDDIINDVYVDSTNMSAYSYNISNVGALGSSASIYTTSGMNGTSGQYLTSGGTGSNIWASNNTTIPWSVSQNSGLTVSGDAEFEGKVKINGQDLAEFMDTISKRLAILVPDPEKLEHFEALKKAYQHYKTLEALCEIPKEIKE
jgi:hypothetical protein